jgi:putative transposase
MAGASALQFPSPPLFSAFLPAAAPCPYLLQRRLPRRRSSPGHGSPGCIDGRRGESIPTPTRKSIRPFGGYIIADMSRAPRPTFAGGSYFITSVTYLRKKWFEDPTLAQIVAVQWEYYSTKYDFGLDAYCVMPDHYHVIVNVGVEKTISQILHAVHSYTATLINEELGHQKSKIKIWQGEAWDEVIRDQDSYWKRIAYIFLNPYRAEIVDRPLHRYPHSNIGDWLDTHGEDFMNDLISAFG